MTDLIERLVDVVNWLNDNDDFDLAADVEKAITILREQEIHIEDCSKRNETDADRIDELELGRDEEIEGLNELIERSIKREDIAKAKIKQFEQALEEIKKRYDAIDLNAACLKPRLLMDLTEAIYWDQGE